jgi:hypothetical protein
MELISNGDVDYNSHTLTTVQQLVATPPDGNDGT